MQFGGMDQQMMGMGGMNTGMGGMGGMNTGMGGMGGMNPAMGGMGGMNPAMGGMGGMNPAMGGMGGMNPAMVGMGGMGVMPGMVGMGGMGVMPGMVGMGGMPGIGGIGGQMPTNNTNISIDDNQGWNLIFENQNDRTSITIRISEQKTVKEAISKYMLKSGRTDKCKFIFNNKELYQEMKICQSGLNNLSRILVISTQNVIGAI